MGDLLEVFVLACVIVSAACRAHFQATSPCYSISTWTPAGIFATTSLMSWPYRHKSARRACQQWTAWLATCGRHRSRTQRSCSSSTSLYLSCWTFRAQRESDVLSQCSDACDKQRCTQSIHPIRRRRIRLIAPLLVSRRIDRS